ncbi:MAG: ABC transporter permease [Candidatus Aminicenantes bacterium]|nr:MAG: ABC transporter permease [Candidatus Aminicenantes bacterium]
MFKNYLKIAFRNILKQKLFSFITVIGLAVGITCCLLIMLHVKQELSYDSFYTNADKVYRIGHKVIRPTRTSISAASPAPLAPALEAEYPEIEHITRVYFDSQVLFEYEEKQIYEDRVIYADPEFFDVFPFPLLEGDPSHLLDSPQSMVITASMAEKYFGDEDPIGKALQVNKQQNVMVTGVMEDVPVDSHYHFDFVISFLARNEQNFGLWLNLWTGFTTLYTYAVLPEDINIEDFQARIEDIITRHSGKRPDVERKTFLQPLKSIYLHSHLEDEIETNNFVSNLVILSTIAFLILIIACINYMNLSTAQSSKRAREVGMRKVLGAQRYQLIKQFMGESILLTLVAMFISITTVELLMPAFSSLVGKPVDFQYGENILFLTGFFFVALVIGVLSSVYPAVFLSRHQPIKTLKGIKEAAKTTFGQIFFKRSLVVIQFVVSILLIVCTLIINQQLKYMRTAHLGFDKAHTLTVPIQSESGRKQYETIKNELMTYPGVVGATACLRAPISGNVIVTYGIPESLAREQAFHVYHNFVDMDYMDNFGIQLVAGRKFSREFATDIKEAYIVNEATVRKSGFASADEAINKRFRTGMGIQGTIIGVMRDFHMSSFHEEIEPMILSFDPEYFWEINIKIKSDDLPGTLASVEKTFKSFLPEYPFNYSFLDEDIDALYLGEEQTGKIIRTFSFIAILIACLGLFGLAAFAAEKRTKEIGVRKVLGATSSNIMVLLSTEFTRWILLANILAWPIVYFAMNKWLQGFAYRIIIRPWPFVLGALLSFAIAMMTVSYQAIKSGVSNPVDSLRYE